MNDQPTLPRAGCLWLLLPVIAVIAVFAAYAWFGLHVWRGRPPAGSHVALDFEGCEGAAAVVSARLETMGFDANVVVVPTGFRVDMRLPADPAVAEQIPATLATPGHVTLTRGDGQPLIDRIATAAVRMDLRGVPTTVFALTPEQAASVASWQKQEPGGETVVFFDGAEIARKGNQPQTGSEIEVEPTGPDERVRMEVAAARGVTAAHPLPCPVSLRNLAVAPPAG